MVTNSVSKYFLVTGASRGLGLELTKGSLFSGNKVFALTQESSDHSKLSALSKEFPDSLFICIANYSDERQMKRIATFIAKETDHLDVIINNAAVLIKDESILSLNKEQLLDTFFVNTVIPVEIVKLSLPFLKKSQTPKVINISSNSGVTARVKSFNGLYSYKTSKSALNMLTRIMAFELDKEGIPVIAVEPGWMRTDMGGAAATNSPADSAAGILRVVQGLTKTDSGSFLNNNGDKLNW